MNLELFKVINGLAEKNYILDKIMILFSNYVPYLFMASIALMYIYGLSKGREKLRLQSVDIFIITCINLLIAFIIGSIYYIPRPFVSQNVNLLYSHIADASFPSDHAIGTMSIAIGLLKYNKTYGIVGIITSLIVGFSRVYVGHHYPLDVIGGFIIVIISNYLYSNIMKDKAKNIYFNMESIIFKVIKVKK